MDRDKPREWLRPLVRNSTDGISATHIVAACGAITFTCCEIVNIFIDDHSFIFKYVFKADMWTLPLFQIIRLLELPTSLIDLITV